MRRVGIDKRTLLACALALSTTAALPPPNPVPPTIRLDESPALPLLEPFRHARGRPATTFSVYQEGRFGGWIDRPWVTLEWRPSSNDVPPMPTDWPFTAAGHWFVASPEHVE